MRTLFRRCLDCGTSTPACPSCAAGEKCSLSLSSCNVCASTSCVKIADSDSSTGQVTTTSSHKSVAGAIAGGVIGGIVVIILIIYLVWRFWIKKRRQEFDGTEYPEEGSEKGGDAFSARRNARASTHTVASIASSTLTRASNIIQIAYIPGVTNRSVESSPDPLAPPVPPIPAAASTMNSAASTPQIGQEQHFFMPSNLRYSDYSEHSDRPQSMAPSVASTAYRNNAVVDPVPAQTMMPGKATTVSVKSGRNSPTGHHRSPTPPMPAIDPRKHGHMLFNTGSPIVARTATAKSVNVSRSTSTKTANNGAKKDYSGSEPPRAALTIGQDRSIASSSPRHNGNSSTFDDASSDEEIEPNTLAGVSLMGHGRRSPATTTIYDSPVSKQSSFKPTGSSPVSSQSRSSPGLQGRRPSRGGLGHKKTSSLNQIIEEATRRATLDPQHGGLGSFSTGNVSRGASPFSDAHAAATP